MQMICVFTLLHQDTFSCFLLLSLRFLLHVVLLSLQRRVELGGSVIFLCSQYRYIGAPVRIPAAPPARRQPHPIVRDLLDRLQCRLRPLQWLTNNSTGISIPVARTSYVTFIRSVIDYLSPALIQLPKSSLQPLETFQKKAMRVILGCSLSTRVVNMQAELNISPIIDRITYIMTRLTAKCLHSPRLAPHYGRVVRRAVIEQPQRIPSPLQHGSKRLIKTICTNLQGLATVIPEEEDVPGPPPWMLPAPDVHYTPTSTAAHPALQQQRALETITTVSSFLPVSRFIYTDGSV